MSYAPYYLVRPRQQDSHPSAQSARLQARTRAAESTYDRGMNRIRNAWRFIADRPLA